MSILARSVLVPSSATIAATIYRSISHRANVRINAVPFGVGWVQDEPPSPRLGMLWNGSYSFIAKRIIRYTVRRACALIRVFIAILRACNQDMRMLRLTSDHRNRIVEGNGSWASSL